MAFAGVSVRESLGQRRMTATQTQEITAQEKVVVVDQTNTAADLIAVRLVVTPMAVVTARQLAGQRAVMKATPTARHSEKELDCSRECA